ncbi:hypothetical protein MLD38_018382 [Melastoma candidum]|uniref:Uncharacterized protein n=1 Tax=Melastoma candidum TaxID=119954 RepID=A0ACB9QX63_9MYRT|nr:hypothetical protein MLD38_018382 [Melastoma candidum]
MARAKLSHQPKLRRDVLTWASGHRLIRNKQALVVAVTDPDCVQFVQIRNSKQVEKKKEALAAASVRSPSSSHRSRTSFPRTTPADRTALLWKDSLVVFFGLRCWFNEADNWLQSRTMCYQNSWHAVEDINTAEESLLIYCKPVELYNIIYRRSQHNPSFLRRCLQFKRQARRRQRFRDGIVIFNYRDHDNVQRKVEVTGDYSCPFCLMQCASFKGLRLHLNASHDFFNFEFWVVEEYQAVNVSVKVEMLRPEAVRDLKDLKIQTYFFCSKPRRRHPRTPIQDKSHVHVEYLELPSRFCVDGEKADKASYGLKALKNGAESFLPDYPVTTDCLENVASNSSVSGASIAMSYSSIDRDSVKSSQGSDPTCLLLSRARKPTLERLESKTRGLLLKRQFFHSHRVQPMAMEQVLSDKDSEDEVDDGIADFDDRRMLDDFVDVTKDEKHLMHLWNSFVRKQKVLADGHVPWACEAFSKLHGQELILSPPLFWCWRLFLIKLWNHGLLDAATMNSCNVILEEHRTVASKGKQHDVPDQD